MWPATDLVHVWDTGGDAFISICTWQAGYAMTDPGYSFFHPDVNMFDPGPEDRMGNMMKLVRALDHRCDVACQVWQLYTLCLLLTLCDHKYTICTLCMLVIPCRHSY